MSDSSIHAVYLSKQYSKAIKLYSSLLDLHPSHPALLTNRGRAYYAMELYRKCVKDCEEALLANEDYLQAYLVKGQGLVGLGNKEEAREVMERGLRRGKSNIECDAEILVELQSAIRSLGDDGSEVASLPSPSQQPPPSSSSSSSLSDSVSGSGSGSIVVSSPTDGGEIPLPPSIPNINVGFFYVNNGNYEMAIRHFSSLLATGSEGAKGAIYVGRGSAFALHGEFHKADLDFTSAIAINPGDGDAWKRRGQVRSAMGLLVEALVDFTKAAGLSGKEDPDVYYQRGTANYKLKNYRRTIHDFQQYQSLLPSPDLTDHLPFNFMGLSFNSCGNTVKAVAMYQRAVEACPTFKEGWANMGQAYREGGDAMQAHSCFDRALAVDRGYVHSYYLKGLLYYGEGRPQDCLEMVNGGLKFDPRNENCLLLKGLCLHMVGRYNEACAVYTFMLSIYTTHSCWYQRELAKYLGSRLYIPLSAWTMDGEVDPAFKEYSCRREPVEELLAGGYTQQPDIGLAEDVNYSNKVSDSLPLSPPETSILRVANTIGSSLQLQCPGFLSNKRQHRQCGLAVIQMAQRLRAVIYRADAGGEGERGGAIIYRDWMSIAVFWRQISDPNDSVWWIDQLPTDSFHEGFGLQTPLVSGQCHVIRYYPYFEQAFTLTKRLVDEQYPLTDDMREAVYNATDCKELYGIMKRDFWVVTPCESSVDDEVMEGTRLTLQRSDPEGHLFTIRTPGTPNRWRGFDANLTLTWDGIVREGLAGNGSNSPTDVDKVFDLALTFFYYWVSFGPLTRGSAATGYTALFAILLAFNVQLDEPMLPGVQLDWEAILLPSPSSFIAAVKSQLMKSARVASVNVEEVPNVVQHVSFLRTAIKLLNAD